MESKAEVMNASGERGRDTSSKDGNPAMGSRLFERGIERKHLRHSPASGSPKMAISLCPAATYRYDPSVSASAGDEVGYCVLFIAC